MPGPVQTFWNTKTEQLSGRRRRSTVSAAQTGYKKAGYDWAAINSDIQPDLTATAFPGNAQFPTSAQGWVDIHFNGAYSAKRQIAEKNWDNSEPEFVLRIRTDCPHNAVGIIDPGKPWQVVYHNAFGQGANLRYGIWHGKTSRVEHVIEITEMPPGDSEYLEYNFYLESNDATAFVGENFDQRPWAGNAGDFADVLDVSVFLAKGSSHDTLRGATVGKPVCWWTNIDGSFTKKPVKVRVEILPDGVTVKGTKYVKRSDIAEALAQGSVYRADVTFYPDASPETSSVDGTVLCTTSGSWATVIAGPGVYKEDAAAIGELWTLSLTVSNTYQYHRQMFFGFDTSSIGAGQAVDSAVLNLKLYNTSSSGGLGLSSQIYATTPASNTALANSDYMAFGSTPLTDTARGVSSESFTISWVARTLNLDGRNAVDMEGVTNLGMDFTVAHEGGSPTWASSHSSQLSVQMAENGGTAGDPYLTVTHSAAASFGAWYAHNTNPGGW